ncbi:inositol monophosphatase [Arthrobacter sp. Sa2CUA1]|uniref:Inositol-1-monophosphatase n=1 Tax=Arthrobacter gallicola TaxID=2762225 RepID=A0ABR8UVV0_9MICC|nr:inositol monophosphatase family protein [Arthrobacter gallicola]MBD7996211.1 inositol monophosphatase [Arthrobacter gallicola]
MPDIHEITGFTKRIALAAGAIAMEGFRNRELNIDLKKDFHDMVTKYDRACEEYIRSEILAHYPESTIVGEEDGSSVGSGPLTWHIDPIDGTANFARGLALWAVSIGVALDGEMVVGVVYDPANEHLFWADDRGAFLGEEPMHSWGSTAPAQATVACSFPLPRDLVHFPDLALTQFAEVVQQFAHVRTFGSSCISLCWVAAGWIDATISFEADSWDVAASAFIVRRAGGTYVSYLNGEAQPETRDYEKPHYVAAIPGANFELLHEILRTQSKRPLPAASLDHQISEGARR